MQNNVSTSIGMTIIIVFIIVFFGGAFGYQYFAKMDELKIEESINKNTSPFDTTPPSISYVAPNPALVGSPITVIGDNLSGFEGDKNLFIENLSGESGIIYGNTESTENTIVFTLGEKYCTVDNSYSGLPCPSYITITPGLYKIYSKPYDVASNRIILEIIAPL